MGDIESVIAKRPRHPRVWTQLHILHVVVAPGLLMRVPFLRVWDLANLNARLPYHFSLN